MFYHVGFKYGFLFHSFMIMDDISEVINSINGISKLIHHNSLVSGKITVKMGITYGQTTGYFGWLDLDPDVAYKAMISENNVSIIILTIYERRGHSSENTRWYLTVTRTPPPLSEILYPPLTCQIFPVQWVRFAQLVHSFSIDLKDFRPFASVF